MREAVLIVMGDIERNQLEVIDLRALHFIAVPSFILEYQVAK